MKGARLLRAMVIRTADYLRSGALARTGGRADSERLLDLRPNSTLGEPDAGEDRIGRTMSR